MYSKLATQDSSQPEHSTHQTLDRLQAAYRDQVDRMNLEKEKMMNSLRSRLAASPTNNSIDNRPQSPEIKSPNSQLSYREQLEKMIQEKEQVLNTIRQRAESPTLIPNYLQDVERKLQEKDEKIIELERRLNSLMENINKSNVQSPPPSWKPAPEPISKLDDSDLRQSLERLERLLKAQDLERRHQAEQIELFKARIRRLEEERQLTELVGRVDNIRVASSPRTVVSPVSHSPSSSPIFRSTSPFNDITSNIITAMFRLQDQETDMRRQIRKLEEAGWCTLRALWLSGAPPVLTSPKSSALYNATAPEGLLRPSTRLWLKQMAGLQNNESNRSTSPSLPPRSPIRNKYTSPTRRTIIPPVSPSGYSPPPAAFPSQLDTKEVNEYPPVYNNRPAIATSPIRPQSVVSETEETKIRTFSTNPPPIWPGRPTPFISFPHDTTRYIPAHTITVPQQSNYPSYTHADMTFRTSPSRRPHPQWSPGMEPNNLERVGSPYRM